MTRTFIPANNVVKPNIINTVVHPNDFLDCALIPKSFRMAPVPLSTVELALIALKSDTRHAEADQGEGEQNFPMRDS